MSEEELEYQSLELHPNDDPEGIKEAIRRDEEMDRSPSASLTHDEFLAAFGRKQA